MGQNWVEKRELIVGEKKHLKHSGVFMKPTGEKLEG